MFHLRETEGTGPHRRACQYHITQCKLGAAPIHAQLATEGQKIMAALIAAARATEDAEDAATSASAVSDGAEISLENALRDLLADAGKADREEPALNAQGAIFPGGLGEMIDPEGALQLTVMPAFHVRLAPFKAHPALAATIGKVAAAESSFAAALADEDLADQATDAAFQAELDARRAVREQLESAHGQLRSFYKGKPKMAERFFMKKDRGARKKKSPKGGGTP